MVGGHDVVRDRRRRSPCRPIGRFFPYGGLLQSLPATLEYRREHSLNVDRLVDGCVDRGVQLPSITRNLTIRAASSSTPVRAEACWYAATPAQVEATEAERYVT
jgi:hypothetical protein